MEKRLIVKTLAQSQRWSVASSLGRWICVMQASCDVKQETSDRFMCSSSTSWPLICALCFLAVWLQSQDTVAIVTMAKLESK
eukprot:4889770-Amphidinium_carterae.2